MKKNTIILTLIAILVMAAPVAAKKKEPVGERINVALGTQTMFPAGEPFHISHGWLADPNEAPPGRWDFELEVDDVFRDEDFVVREADPNALYLLRRMWVHNFPDGMTGEHTFTGRWFAPCRYAVDEGLFPGPCPTPNAKVEVVTRSLTVTFLP